MASKLSWRERRWKLFKKVYNYDPVFREKLTARVPKLIGSNPNLEDLTELLYEYNIPQECCLAIVLFLLKPKLKEKDYLEMVKPPFYFWNALAHKMGPTKIYPYSPAEYLKYILKRVDSSGMANYTGIDTKKLNYEALAFFISSGITTIQVSSFVKKQELHDLIDEYWEEIEPMLNENNSGFASSFYSEDLQKAVYAPKTLKHVERDKLIMELSDQPDISDNQILYELAQKGWTITNGNLRKIRSNLRHKNKS